MPEDRIIDLNHVIGICPVGSNRTVLLHQISYDRDKVQASINGIDPVWVDLKEQYMEVTGEMVLGFFLENLFVPFCEIRRFYKRGGAA